MTNIVLRLVEKTPEQNNQAETEVRLQHFWIIPTFIAIKSNSSSSIIVSTVKAVSALTVLYLSIYPVE